MPCPICNLKPGFGADHRACLIALFKTNTIKSVAEWQDLCNAKPKPKCIHKGRIKAMVPIE